MRPLRLNISLARYFSLFCLMFMASACSARKVVAPSGSLDGIHKLAILPVRHSPAARRERAEYLRAALTVALKSQGYAVLDDYAINRACSSETCPERALLAQQTGVDAFVELYIDSVAKNDFVAGYLNSITGTMTVTSPDGTKLLWIEQTESDKGGVVFNSGQLVEGIISQIRNAEGDSFGSLADKYAQLLAGALPPASSSLNQPADLEISDLSFVEEQSQVYRLCISGTAGKLAFLTLDDTRSNLREIQPGHYCGIFRLPPSLNATEKGAVELRSLFGAVDRRPLGQGVIAS